MKKIDMIFMIISVIMIVLLFSLNIYQQYKLEKADNYIKQLEIDFPEYIDVTSGTDAYFEYYDN